MLDPLCSDYKTLTFSDISRSLKRICKFNYRIRRIFHNPDNFQKMVGHCKPFGNPTLKDFFNFLFFACYIHHQALVKSGMEPEIKPLYFEASKDFGSRQFFVFSREFKSV